jgi:hypothetical protein
MPFRKRESEWYKRESDSDTVSGSRRARGREESGTASERISGRAKKEKARK